MTTCLCPKCGHSYSVAEDTLGRKARCKRCGDVFVLVAPAAETDPPAAETQQPELPSEAAPTLVTIR